MKKYSNGKYIEISCEEVTIDKSIEISMRLEALKRRLSATDYIACKIAEGASTREEYAEELRERQSIREEINRLQEDGL